MSELHPLEEVFKKAAADPEARAAFYQALMNSAAHVVGRPEDKHDGAAAHIQLKQWQQPDGSMALPFFASLESLRQTLGDSEPHLALPVVDLFRMAQGVTLVFTTPQGSKAFPPDEIEALLASTMALDPLALALLRAVKENTEEARRGFYSLLVNSQVFVIGKPRGEGDEEPEPGERVMSEHDQFMIASCPHPFVEDELVVPFFSSLEHLKRASKEGQTYLAFPALTFFALTKALDRALILNPGFEPHKLFAKDEVDFLLTSAKPEPFERRTFQPGTKVFLGPPEVYPQELVGALLDFLPRFPEIRTAYLAHMREDTEDAPPVLVIGFEAEGELTEMFRAAGDLVAQYAEEGQAIDFARVDSGEKGLSQYFLEKVSPFYRRSVRRDEPKAEAAAAAKKTPPPKEAYDKPGFFGRLKRIFGGSKNPGEAGGA